jgi:NAD(P)-dependent dehydrogenase (short-subunit alcohol dehydrogenase family)
VSFDFTGKRVLVTGGTRGIGAATVLAFLDAGARVAVNGRTRQSTDEAMMHLPVEAFGVAGDVADVTQCRDIVSKAVAEMGGLDILVNSAGISHRNRFEDVTEDDWDAILDINLKGTFFCIQSALPHLRLSRGNVVNVASDAGLIGEVGLTPYCASKGGVVNLTRALALELAPTVRVNCVCPGVVDTDMVRQGVIAAAADSAATEQALKASSPLNRIADPREIATAILYLAGDHARFITGSALQIDGGTTAGHPVPL